MRRVVLVGRLVGGLALLHLVGCPEREDGSSSDAGLVDRACTAKADCGPKEVCNAGVCVPGDCVVRLDCPVPADQLCNELFKCIPDPQSPIGNQCPAGDQDCDLGEFCSAGTCYDTAERTSCTIPSNCSGDERCDTKAGFCVPNKGGCDRCSQYPELCCMANEEACDPETKRCRPVTGVRCTPATEATDCTPGQRCVNNRCVQCVTNDDCGPGTVCNTATGTCVSAARCEEDSDCPSGRRCALQTHQCTVPQCETDSDCQNDEGVIDRRMRCNQETFQCYLPPPVCQDTDEPNDTMGQATALQATSSGNGFSGSGVLCRGNADYVSFPVTAGKRLSAVVTLTPGTSSVSGNTASLILPGSLDPVDTKTFSSYGDGTVTLRADLTETGTAYIRLTGSSNKEDKWTWAVSVTFTDPAQCATEAGEPNNILTQASNSVLDLTPMTRALCDETDVDHHLYHVGPSIKVTVLVEFLQGQLKVDLLDTNGTILDARTIYNSPLRVFATTGLTAKDVVLRIRHVIPAPTEPVEYTVTVTETAVQPCDDAASEPSETRLQARSVSLGSTTGAICDYGDKDWYKFTLERRSPLTATVAFDTGNDLEIRLEDATGTFVDDATSAMNPEVLTVNSLAAGTYYLQVTSFKRVDDYPIRYTLELVAPGFCENDSLDDGAGNDTAATATNIRELVSEPLSYSQTLQLCPADQDWFRLLAVGTERITASAAGPEGMVVTTFLSGSSGLTEVGRSHSVTLENGTTAELVSVPVGVAAGTYMVKVAGGATTQGSYRLAIFTTEDPCEGMPSEPESNDAPANAVAVPEGGGVNQGSLCPADDRDIWWVQTGAGATITATVSFDATQGDIDLELWQPGQAAALAVDDDADEGAAALASLQATAPVSGRYHVVVKRKPGGTLGQAYQLTAVVTGGSSSSSQGVSSSGSDSSSASGSSGAVSSSGAPQSSSAGEPGSSSSEPGSSSSGTEPGSSSADAPSSASGDSPSSSSASSGDTSSASSTVSGSSSGPVNPPVELCTGGADEDEDGFIDCADQVCFDEAICEGLPPEDCSGGEDEDGDGRVDCADSECLMALECKSGEKCDIPGDDDADGVADCEDPECRGVPGSTCPGP